MLTNLEAGVRLLVASPAQGGELVEVKVRALLGPLEDVVDVLHGRRRVGRRWPTNVRRKPDALQLQRKCENLKGSVSAPLLALYAADDLLNVSTGRPLFFVAGREAVGDDPR